MKSLRHLSVGIFALLLSQVAWAQKPGPLAQPNQAVARPATLPQIVKPAGAPHSEGSLFDSKIVVKPIASSAKPTALPGGLKVDYYDNDLPIQISGVLEGTKGLPIEQQVAMYLGAVAAKMQIRDSDEEWKIKSIVTDELGQTHVRVSQQYMDLPVWASEIVLHARKNGQIDLMNGRYIPTPNIENTIPSIAEDVALGTVEARLSAEVKWVDIPQEHLFLIDGPQITQTLMVYSNDLTKAPRLVWHFKVYPNVMSRYEVFVDAHTGEVLDKINTLCNFDHAHGAACTHQHETIENTPPVDGPFTANALDLGGVSRTINTYQVGSTYYLIDGSRPMFNLGQSTLPDEPVGAIWTINGNNTSPENNNFNLTQVTSNNNNWGSNPKAVSSQYNGGQSYLYFKNKFNRNSINGQGGTIVSIINVSESNGTGMDNAFWNGQAMFYGNGNDIFTPLAEALDVAGHEMSHGVIEKTANLTYQNESGALNESFADIFGAMIDGGGTDWKIGEDIVQPGVFPNNALRSLEDPHNGGSSLSQFYWQPKHTNEQYTGSQDNGGVHINSGIPNHAYYLFATTAGVGADKAEQAFYRALDQYLVASSKFIDLRAAVLSAISDLGYGASVTAAANAAFNAVGIGSGGDTGGESYQVDIAPNPGDDLILFTTLAQDNISFTDEVGTDLGTLTENIKSRPSVTDNGVEFVWIGFDNKMYYMTVDWATGVPTISVIQADPIWRNVVIAKDGSKIAAITDNLDNIISVYSFDLQQWQDFTLSNPTTASGGANTGDVQYADQMEFDLSSQYLLYDAFNELSDAGTAISYWDAGILEVWEKNTNTFATGFIQKLYNQLPANVSVGNPTFAKNSPYIIAFDYIDSNDGTYTVVGANIQTGNAEVIYENNDLGYPNYSRLDNKVIFNTTDNFGSNVGIRSVGADKITGTGTATLFIDGGYWGVWFANGTRSLVSTEDVNRISDLLVVPNPTSGFATIELQSETNEPATIELYDMSGRLLTTSNTTLQMGKNQLPIDVQSQATGVYRVQVSTQKQRFAATVVKQ